MHKQHQLTHNNNNNKHVSHQYTCALFVPTHLNDAISAIEIYDDVILIGTYMGNAQLIYINPDTHGISDLTNNTNNQEHNHIILPQTMNILELANENISCVNIYSDILNIAVGDYEIIHINLNSEISTVTSNIEGGSFVKGNFKLKNYSNENEHIKYCETCTCMMTKDYFLKVNTEFGENGQHIVTKKFGYENKNLNTLETVTGVIDTTNYSVPFDFDGDKYLYVDYLSPTKRRLCVYYTLSFKDNQHITIDLNETYEHISHMKLMPRNNIFIVKGLNACEIIKIKQKGNIAYMKVIEAFTHIGAEVIATSMYVDGTKVSESNMNINHKEMLNNEGDKTDKSIRSDDNNNNNNNQDIYAKLHDKISVKSDSPLEMISNNSTNRNMFLKGGNLDHEDNLIKAKMSDSFNKTNNKSQSKYSNIHILTLDYEGNVNIYHNKTITTIFNIYSIANINEDLKDKQLFDMGFPYYVVFNNMYYAITTDHGLCVIQRQNKLQNILKEH